MTTDIFALLGKERTSPEIHNFLNEFAPIETNDDPPFRQYIGSPKNGIDLLLEKDFVIAIQIYLQPTRVFSAFSKDLPFGIKASMSQAEILRLLGPGVQSDSIGGKYFIKEKNLKLIINYDENHSAKRLAIELA